MYKRLCRESKLNLNQYSNKISCETPTHNNFMQTNKQTNKQANKEMPAQPTQIICKQTNKIKQSKTKQRQLQLLSNESFSERRQCNDVNRFTEIQMKYLS